MLIIIIDNLLLRDVHLVDDELLSPPAEHAAKEFSEAMLGAQLPAHERLLNSAPPPSLVIEWCYPQK